MTAHRAVYRVSYEVMRNRMALDEVSLQEVSERVQIALTVALIHARDGRHLEASEHALFAADASRWLNERR